MAQPYQLGSGPIEGLLARVADGELTDKAAMVVAATPQVAQAVSVSYASALRQYAFDLSTQGDTPGALRVMNLLKAACFAVPDTTDAVRLRTSVTIDWIEIVHRHLHDWADGRLYREAMRLGDAIIDSLPRDAEPETRGLVNHILGTLNLDPYAARSSVGYESQIMQWKRRFWDANSNELVGIPESQWAMPSPKEGLARAEQYLRRAAELRVGHAKGLSLKALAQALQWQEITNSREIDRKELVATLRGALGCLDPARDPEPMLSVLSSLQDVGETVDPAPVQRIFKTSLDAFVERQGKRAAIELVTAASAVVGRADPEAALNIMITSRALVELSEAEDQRIICYQREFLFILQSWGGPVPKKLAADGMKAMAGRIVEENVDIRVRVAKLLSLAAASQAWNEEISALALVHAVRKMAPVFWKTFEKPLGFFEANLFLGAGSNAYSTQTWEQCVRAYGRACRAYLDVGCPGSAINCVERIWDVVRETERSLAVEVSVALLRSMPTIEIVGGEAATRALRRLCSTAIARTQGPLNLEAFFVILQCSKGYRFGSALTAGTSHLEEEDELGQRLLTELQGARASTPRDASAIDPGADEAVEFLLAAYETVERSPDAPSTSRVANLERAYDHHLVERLLKGANDAAVVLSTEQVQRALDRRTVLVYAYVGADEKGSVAVYVVLISSERVRLVRTSHGFPTSSIQITAGERVAQLDAVGMLVSTVRQEVRAPSGPWPVSQGAAEHLESGLRAYFGDRKMLDEFRAEGKDHLCIVPHGALHYFPFHLIGPMDQPLAEEWVVTYLPNLSLLTSTRGRPGARAHRSRPITSVGLAYAAPNPHGLPELPAAVSEAKEVAAVFGQEPLLDENATEGALTNALQNSHFVHLAMHGAINVDAPAFQCLFVTPDGTTDGRVCAYEVIKLDLRGLELLTLSACETALGRFDLSDNLRGLPASFLLAGVSTLVGTMWKVSDDASREFFVHLYRVIHDGGSRLDAFAAAQKHTRQLFPRYEDWGAFYMAGDWD